MKTKYILSVFAALLVVAASGASHASRGVATSGVASASETAAAIAGVGETAAPEPQQSPFPDERCPGVPGTNCCMWQLEKRADGERRATYTAPYACDTGQTRRGDMTVTMRLNSGGRVCDPPQSVDLIPNGSTLEARGTNIQRIDGFGHFSGEFVIRRPDGRTVFTGRIETLDRVGTHRLFFNCEQCNPLSHFEGWITGKGTDLFPNHSIRALVVARGTAPSPTVPRQVLTGSINGTFLKCP